MSILFGPYVKCSYCLYGLGGRCLEPKCRKTAFIFLKYQLSLWPWHIYMKKCRPWDGHSQGTMQCRCSCQIFCSIHNYVVLTLCLCCVYTCTVQLYTLTVTVQLSRWPIRASHPSRGHHTHITHHTRHTRQSQMLSSGSPTKNGENKAWP